MAAPRKYTDEFIAEVERLSFTMTRKQIAEKLGCTDAQIKHLIARLKLEGKWNGTGYDKTRKGMPFTGCDKDCERCPYPDCLIPDAQAPIGLDIDEILKR